MKKLCDLFLSEMELCNECFVTNGNMVSEGTFAGVPLSEADEMNDLADALYNGDTMVVDSNGVVHLEGGENGVTNGTTVSDGTFAGVPLSEADEMNDLADALYNGDTMVVDSNGVVHLEGGENGVTNGTTVSDGTFATSLPSNPDQWYNKNPMLFRTEVATMRQRYPKAGFNFFKQTGNMYWTIEMKISQTGFSSPWKFVLVYDKNHPHNRGYGGSIKVFPIKPNDKDLRRIAREHGRAAVPHLLHDPSLGTYLCTRKTEDVEDGRVTASSAAQVAAWAADWAVHFEVGIRDSRVWNKWCDDEHFRSLMV